jgi:hypothetical protein
VFVGGKDKGTWRPQLKVEPKKNCRTPPLNPKFYPS